MTNFNIKLIALATMLIDHTAVIFNLHEGYRAIGRIALPLFIYLIAEGCLHTKSIEKYLLRLGLFALISEIPYDLAFNENISFLRNTNIFYTLWLGVAAVYFCKKVFNKNLVLSLIPLGLAMITAEVLSSDYGAIGVFFVFSIAVSGISETKHLSPKLLQLLLLTLFSVVLYANMPTPIYIIGSLMAIPIIFFSNGKLGIPAKWIFYMFYPSHLLVLTFLSYILPRY